MSASAISEEPELDPADANGEATGASAVLEFPCSPAQRRFWVLEQSEPGNPALNVAVRWQLDGPVTADLLEEAFHGIIARHEVLRTTFHEIDGAPVQRVLPTASLSIKEIDLSGIPAARREAEATGIAKREAQAPFCLNGAPLMRVTLLRLSPVKSILLVTAHHLVCDGWSIGIIAWEMGLRYAALGDGTQPTLPPLPVQYADYALWQAEWVKAGGLQPEVEYWTTQLAGMTHFEVRPDYPRRAMPTSGGHILSLLLPRAATDALAALARQNGVTMFSVALAGLSAVLSRYTADTRVTVGTQVAGRENVELEHLVGLFTNTVVLRTDLSGDPSFVEHVGRIRDVVLGALAHQHTPIDRIISIVRPARSLGRDPLISVNFIFQRSFITNSSYGDISLTDLPSITSGALCDLNFFMVERPEGWRLSCEYNIGLFAAATIETLLHALVRFFGQVVSNPHRRISEYALLDAAEQERLVEEAGRTPLPQALAGQLPGSVRADAKCYVVEPGGQLALPNAAGELWIDGFEPHHPRSSIAEAARFVSDAFGPDRRQRLYRSGILVRRCAEGSFEALATSPFHPQQAVKPVANGIEPNLNDGPRNSTESRLVKIWARVLDVPSVGVADNFFDWGGHSLLVGRLLSQVDASFGERLPFMSLFGAPTVREFAAVLRTAVARKRDFGVVPVNAQGGRRPIFALNNPGLFHHLSRSLGQNQPFLNVCAYDPDTPEELPPQTFEEITTRYVDMIQRARAHGPYVLLGLCVAGNIAFEAAQQLIKRGEQVPLLVLVDAWAPGYFDGLTRRQAVLAESSYRFNVLLCEMRSIARGKLSLRDFIGQRGAVKALRKRLLRAAHRRGRLQSIVLDPYRAWFQQEFEAASRRYRPQPFDGMIQIFHNPSQPSGRFLDPTFGWGKLAKGGLAIHEIPGDHLGIFEQPGAGLMAGHINRALNEMSSGNGAEAAKVTSPS